jgi:hypothetical protein
MDISDNGRRFPFVLTDDAGYILFSSLPLGFSNGENIFSPENFSVSDAGLAQKRIKEYNLGNLILLRNKKDGNAVFLVPFLFPSCRTLVFLFTDISYGISSELCGVYFGDIAFAKRKISRLSRKHEEAYPLLAEVIYSLKIMFLPNADGSSDFGAFIAEKIKHLSLLTCCSTEIKFSGEYISPSSENFDGAMFSLYMLIMLSAASEFSLLRHTDILLTFGEGNIGVDISFDIPETAEAVNAFELRFKNAVRKLDEVCERLNLPTYFIADGKFRSGIIPTRIEASLMELKAGEGQLKYEEQNENDKRNIFTALPFSVEE